MAKKKQKNAGAVVWMLLCTVLVVAVTAGILYVVYGQNSNTEPSDAPDFIAEIPVYTDYISPQSQARPGKKRDILYIVIHETDNTGTHSDAKAHNQYLHENCWKEQKSWHYTVDDHEIWHHLPDNEVGYHAGDRSKTPGGNQNGIGIELCVNEGGNFAQTRANAAQLTAYLLKKYNLNIDAVKKHQDFSGKECPQIMITQNLWEDFLNQVQNDLQQQKQEEGSA